MVKRKTLVISVAALAVLVLGGAFIGRAAGVRAKGKAKYVGTSKCRLCHMKQYKTWKKMKHAKALSALKSKSKENAACLKCHTTGYGKPGGFVSVAETPKLANVGCESCHGPGSEHAKAAKSAPESGKWDKKINKVPQNTCVQCHNPHVKHGEAK